MFNFSAPSSSKLRAAAACFTSLVFSGAAASNSNGTLIIDNNRDASAKTQPLSQMSLSSTTQISDGDIQDLSARFDGLNKLSTTLMKITRGASKDFLPSTLKAHTTACHELYKQIEKTFPHLTQDTAYSEDALFVLLTEKLPFELKKQNIGMSFARNVTLNPDHILYGVDVDLFHIDHMSDSSIRLQNGKEVSGAVLFITPLTDKVLLPTGTTRDREDRINLTPGASDRVVIVDISNHLSSPTDRDFIVREPGSNVAHKKSDIIEKFQQGGDIFISYQEQAVSQTIYRGVVSQYLSRMGLKSKEVATELYASFNSLFAGDLKGAEWVQILKSASLKNISATRDIARSMLFGMVQESLSDGNKIKSASVTDGLVNPANDASVQKSVLNRIYQRFPQLKEIDSKRTNTPEIGYSADGYDDSLGSDEKSEIKSWVAGAMTVGLGLAMLFRKQIWPNRFKTYHSNSTIDHDNSKNDFDVMINDLEVAEIKQCGNFYLSSEIRKALVNGTPIINQGILKHAFDLFHDSDEKMSALGKKALGIIFDIQKSNKSAPTISTPGGDLILTFRSMKSVSFDDWFAVHETIYCMLDGEQENQFKRIRDTMLHAWADTYDKEIPLPENYRFLDIALAGETGMKKQVITNAWKRLSDTIATGPLGFLLSEQVAWGSGEPTWNQIQP